MKIIINRITRRISGAELYNVYLLGALKKYKDLEILFSSDNDTLSEKVRKMGYTISPIKPPLYEVGTKKQLLFAILLLPQYALVYWKYFRKNGNFDLIIFESMNEKIFLTFLLKLWNKKIIWIEHGPLFATRRAALIKLLYKLNSNFVDKIICVSKSTQVDLLTAGLNSGKTIVQYIGVDTQKYDIFSPQKSFRMRSKLGLLKKEIIGFLGTVNEEKGIRKFLEVATIISKVKSNAFFVIIGEGNLLEWAKSEAQKRSLSNKFYFTGFIDEIADYLGIFNILLFPSAHLEGLSLSLIEATAMGIPCVATDIGGNREIVLNNKSGLLYSNSSTGNIVELLLQIMSNENEYKKHARAVALEKFSLEKNASKFYQLFTHIYNEK